MNLSSLPQIVDKPYRRIGRGHGSGRVKTSGRGTKGQKAREKIPLAFAGSSLQASWLKRLPLIRGKGKNKSYQNEVVTISLSTLSKLSAGSEVTLKSLKAAKMIDENVTRAKVVDNGDIKVALTVKIPVSATAAEKITKAGGKVE